MAWCIQCRFGRIQSYAQAAKAWQKAVIFNRSDNDLLTPRGLVDRRKKHLAIERTAAKDFILRLYDHPIVTWHKDGSLTICPYSTRSSTKFGNHCTPQNVWVGYRAVSVDGRTYKVSDKITFRPDGNTWKVGKDNIEPWSVPVINRSHAKQALQETGYNEFRDWLKVYMQMAKKPDGRASHIDDKSLVIMLRDRNKWRDLVSCRWSNPDRILSEVRQAIYQECGCIEQKSVPFLD